jgi:hypothetical protein
MKYILDESDFGIFKAECLKYIALFGLTDWRIEFGQHDTSNAAEEFYDLPAKSATIFLPLEWDTEDGLEFNKEACLKNCAKHEVLEILLTPLTRMIDTRRYNQDEMNIVTHSVIRRLEKVI